MKFVCALLLAALAACTSTPKEAAPVASADPAPQAAPSKPVQMASLNGAAAAPASGPFAKWTAIITSADNHAHSGAHSDAFDNARRDVAAQFVAAGFAPENMRHFSVQPSTTDPTSPGYTDQNSIRNAVQTMLGDAGDGCLFYFTTHGSPAGMAFNGGTLSPDELKGLLDRTCGGRPTVVIVSACYSGVFVPVVSAPNRMVMTAARKDRSSFGCGDNDKYPYFDACMIEDLPGALSFPDLADRVKNCVSTKETEQHFTPPSEPQVSIGPQVFTMLTNTHFQGR